MSVQENGKDEEKDGREKHDAGGDDGEQSQFSFERTDLVFGEEGFASAHDRAHIVSGAFLHDNDDDHGDARNCHKDEKCDTKPEKYVGFCGCCDQCIQHGKLLIITKV